MEFTHPIVNRRSKTRRVDFQAQTHSGKSPSQAGYNHHDLRTHTHLARPWTRWDCYRSLTHHKPCAEQHAYDCVSHARVQAPQPARARTGHRSNTATGTNTVKEGLQCAAQPTQRRRDRRCAARTASPAREASCILLPTESLTTKTDQNVTRGTGDHGEIARLRLAHRMIARLVHRHGELALVAQGATS